MKHPVLLRLKKLWILWFSLTAIIGIFICQPAAAQTSPGHTLWKLHDLQQLPESRWVEQSDRVWSLFYRSVDFEGRPTEVFAYYSNPEILLGKKPSGQKFPGLVLIHGGGGTAFQEWVEKWAADGYAAIAMDLSGRDGNGNRFATSGPDQSHEAKFSKIENSPLQDVWTYHAVASGLLAHSWLLNRPEVDETRTGVTGISWGGYLTSIVGAIDHRFKAAVPVYGCGFYDESDVFGKSLDQLSPAGKQKWMKWFDPSAYLPNAAASFLFLNGNKDRFYNVVPYHKTYQLVKEPLRNLLLIPDMKHDHFHGWAQHEIKYFFDQILFGNAPLPFVFDVQMDSDSLTAGFQSPVTLRMAEFYYSSDTLMPNEFRKWEKLSTTIDPVQGILRVKKPVEGFRYGFFHVIDNRNLSGSSPFIFSP